MPLPFTGNERLGEMVTTMVQLKVALLGQDDERYFSVFDGFEVDDAPMVLNLGGMNYRMGTAGKKTLVKWRVRSAPGSLHVIMSNFRAKDR